MKSIIALLITCGVCLGAASPASTAPAAASTQPLSGTRYANRVVRITSSGLSADDGMNFSESIQRNAIRLEPAVLGRTVDDPTCVQVNPVARHGSADVNVVVNLPPDVRPAAKELVDQAIDAATKTALDDFKIRLTEELKPRQEAMDEARERVDEAEQKASFRRAEMRKLAGRADISGKTITDAMTKLEEEKQKLELDQMAKTARREELEKQIAVASERIQKKVDADQIGVELQKVADARQEKAEFAAKQVGSGLISTGEEHEAVAQLAEARAKLLERKRDAAAEAGGDALAALNRELLALAVDLRELDARLRFVEVHLPGLRDAMDQLDAWERAEAELQMARKYLEKASEEVHDYRRRNATMRPPRVEVLASDDRENPPLQPNR